MIETRLNAAVHEPEAFGSDADEACLNGVVEYLDCVRNRSPTHCVPFGDHAQVSPKNALSCRGALEAIGCRSVSQEVQR